MRKLLEAQVRNWRIVIRTGCVCDSSEFKLTWNVIANQNKIVRKRLNWISPDSSAGLDFGHFIFGTPKCATPPHSMDTGESKKNSFSGDLIVLLFMLGIFYEFVYIKSGARLQSLFWRGSCGRQSLFAICDSTRNHLLLDGAWQSSTTLFAKSATNDDGTHVFLAIDTIIDFDFIFGIRFRLLIADIVASVELERLGNVINDRGNFAIILSSLSRVHCVEYANALADRKQLTCLSLVYRALSIVEPALS